MTHDAVMILDAATTEGLAEVGAPVPDSGYTAVIRLPARIGGPDRARPWHWRSTEGPSGEPSFRWWFGPPDALLQYRQRMPLIPQTPRTPRKKGQGDAHEAMRSSAGRRPLWSRDPASGDANRTTVLMGIVNVTPDSFSDGGQALATDEAVRIVRQLFEAGADWVDIGGESTRPGHQPVEPSEEWRRVGPVIEGLSAFERARVSIDTRHAALVSRLAPFGIGAVNDVSCLEDPDMLDCLRASDLGYVLMFNRRERYPEGQVRLKDILYTLEGRMGELHQALGGLERVAVDPGLGFAYGHSDNVRVLKSLRAFGFWGVPVLVGPSRKAFLGRITGRSRPADRDTATAALAALAMGQGASILRVHNVGAVLDALHVAEAMR